MVKRSKPRRYYDEQTFAVTVRYFTPFGGTDYYEFNNWLKDRVGDDFAHHPGGAVNGEQCSMLMINDVAVALACCRKFDLRIAGLPRHLP